MNKKFEELLADLDVIVTTLKASLPFEAPIYISIAVDPSRALVLRESCFHRITELADSAYDAFKKRNSVAGCLLTRAILETTALFTYFVDQVSIAIQKQDLEELRGILSQILIGSKAEQAKYASHGIKPLHINVALKHIVRSVPILESIYAFFSDVSHPNASGLNKTYLKLDWEKKIAYFGKEHGTLDILIEANLDLLLITLQFFMGKYNASVSVLEELQKISEGLLKI